MVKLYGGEAKIAGLRHSECNSHCRQKQMRTGDTQLNALGNWGPGPLDILTVIYTDSSGFYATDNLK